MNLFDIILVGVALSMDAATLTIANCLTYKGTLSKGKKLSMPLLFGLFQGVMPLIGFFIGSIFAEKISNFSGYLVSAIFFILAGKILYDFIKDLKEDPLEEKPQKNLTYLALILQAVLTSIDALAVGITLSLELTLSIYIAVLVIAVITLIIVLFALFLGEKLGKAFGKYSSLFGFILLLILAVKNLLESIL